MSHVILAFSSKRSSLISLAIRGVQRWRHSHIVLVSPDGQWYIESTGDDWIDEDGKIRDGVRRMPIAHLYERDDIEFRAIGHPNPYAVWAAGSAYLSRRYDRRYLWSAFFGFEKENPDELACPELIRRMFLDTGVDPLPASVRIPTVRDFYVVSKAMPETESTTTPSQGDPT